MHVTLNLSDGRELEFDFGLHKDINTVVEALKENEPNWSSMMICIVNTEAKHHEAGS